MLPNTKDIKDFWDKSAEYYSTDMEKLSLLQAQCLFNMISFKEDSSVIEVGCGSGVLSCQSAQNLKVKSKYLAIDLSDEMIKIANERKKATLYDQNLVQLEFKSASAEDLSFVDSESIDAYISPMCIHIVTDPKKMLQEAFRVMKKGARIALSVPKKTNNDTMNMFFSAIQEAGFKFPEKAPMRDPFYLSEKDVLINIVKEAGFEVDVYHSLHFPMPIYSAEQFMAFPKGFGPFKGPYSSLDDKQKEKFAAAIAEEFEKRKKEYQAIGLEIMLIFGRKP